MKKFLFGILTVLLPLAPALAGTNTSPIYINNSPVYFGNVPPQIDAFAFLNRSIFDVSTTLLPFQAQNVLAWTNNGAMSSTLGFLFEQDRDGTSLAKKKRKRRSVRNSEELQVSSAHFQNDGQITAGGLQTTFGTVFLSSANPIVGVSATNIQMQGRIDGDELTFVRMNAPASADLSRGGIRVAESVVPACDFFFVSTNFTPTPGITELYWGAGRNNNLGTNGQAFFLSTLPSQFSLSTGLFTGTPFSGSHQVIQRSTFGSLFTNFASLSPFNSCAGDFRAFVHTNADFGNPTSQFVTVVFVATNNFLSTNLDVAVRFVLSSGDIGSFYAPVVEFRTIDYDLVNQANVTNYVTFADASGGETNITLARPLGGGSSVRRPTTHTWIKGRYCNFDTTPIPGFTNFFFGVEPANVPDYDPNIFYSPLFATNRASYLYAASRVQVGQSNSTTFLTTTVAGQTLLGLNTGLSDPSNFTGNVTIDATELNLAGTRIKAEEFISIRTDNLRSNTFAALDAPFIDFDVRTLQEQLVISNIAPATVNRLVGQLAAWSAVWDVNSTNTVGQSTNLNRTRFHVLILDNCLQPQQPVTLNRFAVHAPSTVIFDNISVNSGVTLDSPALTIQSNGALNLPFNQNLAFTNALNLAFFTNYGAVNVSAGAYFGTFETGHIPTNAPPKRKRKRKQVVPPVVPPPLDTFVNHGSIVGSSILVRSTNFDTSGRPLAPATLTANGGVVLVTSSQITVSNAEVRSTGDTEFHGDDLRIANTLMEAGTASTNITQYIRGSIVFDATNSLGDFAEMSTNDWFVSGGFRIPTIPLNKGDFLGSRVYVSAGALVTPRIVWAGEDRGATPNGYQNNLAVGRLVLDGLGGNEFRFEAAGETNAIYVDVLDLRNFATNFSFIFGIPTNFTIYFADITGGIAEGSPEQIDGISSGRVRWIPDFVGPQSGTNITYPNGVTYRFNAGLARSRAFDSDGDGTVNRFDCTPFPIPGEDSSLWFGNCVVDPNSVPSGRPSDSSTVTVSKLSAKNIQSANIRAVSSGNIGLSISFSESDREITLDWDAPAGAASTVEYTDALGSTEWRTLTNFVNGPVNARVTVKDSAAAPLRVYRVRVDAGTQQ
jgi:hypothetical protein